MKRSLRTTPGTAIHSVAAISAKVAGEMKTGTYSTEFNSSRGSPYRRGERDSRPSTAGRAKELGDAVDLLTLAGERRGNSDVKEASCNPG